MIELKQELKPELRQTLELYLSPKMLQMLKMLNVPYIELVEKIEAEASENPMLDVERKDELFEYIKYISVGKKERKEIDFTELPGLENVSDTTKTLEEYLLEQLNLENLDETYKKIGEMIIKNIDERGYIENYTEVREEIMKEVGISRPIVDKVLKIIQSFEPDGVGARNLKECLLIQVREYNFETYDLEEILKETISKHLDNISKKNYSVVAKALEIEEAGVERIAEFIRTNLNPNPGGAFGEAPKHVIPSFSLEKSNGGYKIINLEKNYGPVLKISPEYKKMLEDKKTDAETLKFLKEKLERALDFIENITKRQDTITKIIEIIKETQIPFFERGTIWLKPLMQKDIAQNLGLHPSTVSRAIADKYIQTPQGLFPIKFLCPRGRRGFTIPRIKSMIVDMVKAEDKNKPLSDEEIKKLLSASGIEIKRRTITAYRKELEIPSSAKRLKK